MKRQATFLLVLFMFFSTTFPKAIEAKSAYVLPYPGIMPGSKLYKLDQLQEKVLRFWYFGSFATFDYNRKYADKYLVEAKTLFEYEQYLLGYQALLTSDKYFAKLSKVLKKSSDETKDISEKNAVLRSQTEKHKEVLKNLLQITPETVNWTPEKEKSTVLYLHKAIKNSLDLRIQYE